MNNITKVVAITFLLGASSVWAGEKAIKLSVPGMNCASCPYMVKKAISAVQGVLSVSATMDDRSATVVYDDAKTNGDQIRAATASIGYPSTIVPSTGG